MEDNKTDKEKIQSEKILKEQEGENRLLQFIERWKSIIEIVGVFFAFFVVFASIWSAYEARKISEISESEFKIRNRPYVIIDAPHFSGKSAYYSSEITCPGGKVDKNKNEYQNSVTASLKNISDVPAINVDCNISFQAGNKCDGDINSFNTAIVKDIYREIAFGLPDEIYKAVIEGSEELIINYSIKYTGMLKDNHETNISVIFYAKTGIFGYLKYDIN